MTNFLVAIEKLRLVCFSPILVVACLPEALKSIIAS